MPRSFQKSGILLVAVLVAPACGGPQGAEELEKTTGAIAWGPPATIPHDYLFVTGQAQSQSEADFFCSIAGATLAIVNSSSEMSFLQGEELEHGGGSWWIGYSDSRVEGLWEWPNGSTTGYVNWQPGQPVNIDGTEDCAAMDAATGQLTAVNSGGARNYVCERGISTPHTNGSFPFSASSTSNDTQNYVAFSVPIQYGINVGTCGLANASNTGDTFLRLFDQNGVQLTGNDDACGTSLVGSNLTHETRNCPFGCTYTIHAGCFSNGSCGGTVVYELF